MRRCGKGVWTAVETDFFFKPAVLDQQGGTHPIPRRPQQPQQKQLELLWGSAFWKKHRQKNMAALNQDFRSKKSIDQLKVGLGREIISSDTLVCSPSTDIVVKHAVGRGSLNRGGCAWRFCPRLVEKVGQLGSWTPATKEGFPCKS